FSHGSPNWQSLWNMRILAGMGAADGGPQLGVQLGRIQDHLAGFGILHRVQRNLVISGILDIDHQLMLAHLAHRAEALITVMKEDVVTFGDILVHDVLPFLIIAWANNSAGSAPVAG